MKFWLTFIAALVSTTAVFARETRVRSIDIDVTFYADGRAQFDEKWDVEVGDDFTELYLPKENLGDIGVASFKVFCDGAPLADDGAWDTDRSRARKAGRYGIVRKSGGVELCWGVGDRGHHLYNPVYVLTNTVKGLDDYDMFHMQVLADHITGSPHVRVTFALDEAMGAQLDTSAVRAWGFGYYGTVSFEDGKLVYESDDYDRQSSVIALIRFDKGIFTPASVPGGPFQARLDRALEGASFADDEDEEDDDETSFVELLFQLVVLFLALFGGSKYGYDQTGHVSPWRKKKLLGMSPKDVSWWRDIPMDGDLIAADYALTRLGEDRKNNALASAEILRMIYNGYLDVQKDAKGKVEITFAPDKHGQAPIDPIASDLWSMMLEASGSDRILQDKEFSSWSSKNRKRLYNWTLKMAQIGKDKFRSRGWMNAMGNKFTPEGQTEAQHLLGFKKYLEDFTLSRQRETVEVHLWQEYLVYGALLGVAEKVAKQLKDIDPVLFERTVGYDYGTFTNVLYSTNMLSRAITSSNKAYVASTFSGSSRGGFGGGSSFGGGGGFSGGGSGFGR